MNLRGLGVAAFVFCFAASATALAAPSPAPGVGPAGPDLSGEFRPLFEGRGVVTREQLRPFRILFIPGFNADYLDDTVGYFREARRELRRLGLREGEDYELLKNQTGFSGEKPVRDNAAALAAILRASPRPVFAITHSKGAVDLLETLLVYRDTRAKVRGWFSYQGALGGSILADVVSKGWTRPVMETFLRSYGGSIEALDDLRRPDRHRYLEDHLAEIRDLVREVPVISLVTQQDYREMSLGLRTVATLFDPDYRKNESDGMIAIPDAFLPYAPFVYLTGVSHEDTAEKGDFDRVRLTHATLALLLRASSQ